MIRDCTEIKRKGSMVTAGNDDGVMVARISSFFESVPAAKEGNATSESEMLRRRSVRGHVQSS